MSKSSVVIGGLGVGVIGLFITLFSEIFFFQKGFVFIVFSIFFDKKGLLGFSSNQVAITVILISQS